jgi:hypothetical protein
MVVIPPDEVVVTVKTGGSLATVFGSWLVVDGVGSLIEVVAYASAMVMFSSANVVAILITGGTSLTVLSNCDGGSIPVGFMCPSAPGVWTLVARSSVDNMPSLAVPILNLSRAFFCYKVSEILVRLNQTFQPFRYIQNPVCRKFENGLRTPSLNSGYALAKVLPYLSSPVVIE